jgi:amino-acid N-acetyltransferase
MARRVTEVTPDAGGRTRARRRLTSFACTAIYPPDKECVEIDCIAIHKHYQESGRGDHLLRALKKKALKLGLKKVIVFTTQTAHWFPERGFEPIAFSDLPPKKTTNV